MEFDAKHYVPVLKVKKNEKDALAAMATTVAGRLTPILEIVKRSPHKINLADHLDTSFKSLASSVAAYGPVFLDLRELESEGDAGALATFSRARAEGLDFVPVVGLTRKVGNGPALAHAVDEIALRLTRSELENGDITRLLQGFLSGNGLDPESIHLIVDLGEVDKLIPEGVIALSEAFLAEVPHHSAWRTFTISGCAFPKTLGAAGRHSFALAQRSEWIAWRDSLYTRRRLLNRLPTFSDCGIQHPSGVEDFDPTKMSGSAAARYTAGDNWLLIKGESTKKTSSKIQFPIIAQRLISNTHGSYFSGIGHCGGCEQVIAAASGAPKLGSLGVWRRIGTVHHMATVVKDLASLSWL